MEINAPNYMESVLATATTIAITGDAAGGITVKTVEAGRRFVVFHLYMTTDAATTIKVLSGSTDLTGDILTAVAPAPGGVFDFKNAGTIVFKGDAKGDNLIIDTVATCNVEGFAPVGEVTI
jgi:hypothetical protein